MARALCTMSYTTKQKILTCSSGRRAHARLPWHLVADLDPPPARVQRVGVERPHDEAILTAALSVTEGKDGKSALKELVGANANIVVCDGIGNLPNFIRFSRRSRCRSLRCGTQTATALKES